MLTMRGEIKKMESVKDIKARAIEIYEYYLPAITTMT